MKEEMKGNTILRRGRAGAPALFYAIILIMCQSAIVSAAEPGPAQSLEPVNFWISGFSDCGTVAYKIEDSAGVTSLRIKFKELSLRRLTGEDSLSAAMRCNGPALSGPRLIIRGLGEEVPIWSSRIPEVHICGQVIVYPTQAGVTYIPDTNKALEKLIFQLGIERDLYSSAASACGSRAIEDMAELFGYHKTPPLPSWSPVFNVSAQGGKCRIYSMAEVDYVPASGKLTFYAVAGNCGLLSGVIDKTPSVSMEPLDLTTVERLLENESVVSLHAGRESILAGTRINGVYLSRDRGKTWKSLSKGLPKYTDTQQFEPVLQLHRNDSAVYALTEKSGVFSFSVPDSTWVSANSEEADYKFSAMASNGRQIITSDFFGAMSLSPDQGANWEPLPGVPLPQVIPGSDRTRLTQLVWNSSTLYAVVPDDCLICAGVNNHNGHVMKSLNSGKTWYAVASPVLNVRSLFFEEDEGRLYLAVYNTPSSTASRWQAGVHYSPDNGNSWRSLDNGLMGNVIVYVKAGPHFLYAATDSGDVYIMHRHSLYNATVAVSPGRELSKPPPGFLRPGTAGMDVRFNFNRPLNAPVKISLWNVRGQSAMARHTVNRENGLISLHMAGMKQGVYYGSIDTGGGKRPFVFVYGAR